MYVHFVRRFYFVLSLAVSRQITWRN